MAFPKLLVDIATVTKALVFPLSASLFFGHVFCYRTGSFCVPIFFRVKGGGHVFPRGSPLVQYYIQY